MPVITEDKQLQDFSLGLLAALIRAGETGVNEWHRAKLHQAFVEAFTFVEAELGFDAQATRMQVDKLYGVTADVDDILYYWIRAGYTNRAPGKDVHRFQIKKETADLLVLESMAGDEAVYDGAARKLLAFMAAPYVPVMQAVR